jgi:hypothetical protein
VQYKVDDPTLSQSAQVARRYVRSSVTTAPLQANHCPLQQQTHTKNSRLWSGFHTREAVGDRYEFTSNRTVEKDAHTRSVWLVHLECSAACVDARWSLRPVTYRSTLANGRSNPGEVAVVVAFSNSAISGVAALWWCAHGGGER